jgi:hypothetical protein
MLKAHWLSLQRLNFRTGRVLGNLWTVRREAIRALSWGT